MSLQTFFVETEVMRCVCCMLKASSQPPPQMESAMRLLHAEGVQPTASADGVSGRPGSLTCDSTKRIAIIILTMELNTTREATGCVATGYFLSILWSPNVHYRIHKSSALVSILNQNNSVHTTPIPSLQDQSQGIHKSSQLVSTPCQTNPIHTTPYCLSPESTLRITNRPKTWSS
jgi:hypothetical protein